MTSSASVFVRNGRPNLVRITHLYRLKYDDTVVGVICDALYWRRGAIMIEEI